MKACARKRLLAEFIGALIGDGYISKTKSQFKIGFTGHPQKDFEYYVYLQRMIDDLWNKKVVISNRERGLRIGFKSKIAANELLVDYDLPWGKKSACISIPQKIFKDKDLLIYAIRGIVDTDGSVFVSKKKGILEYPSLEITTSSLSLACQLRTAFFSYDFVVANIRKYKSKLSVLITYKISLFGLENLKKYYRLIGFSNPSKLHKAKQIIAKNGASGI